MWAVSYLVFSSRRVMATTRVCPRASRGAEGRGKAWHVCVFAHVLAAGVIFHRRALNTSHEIHISHRECRTHFLHANTARLTETGTRDSAEAHEAKVVSGSQDANGSFDRSTVTAHKLGLCSCRAHSHGCCKTLAPGLIKTLITERQGQMAA